MFYRFWGYLALAVLFILLAILVVYLVAYYTMMGHL